MEENKQTCSCRLAIPLTGPHTMTVFYKYNFSSLFAIHFLFFSSNFLGTFAFVVGLLWPILPLSGANDWVYNAMPQHGQL